MSQVIINGKNYIFEEEQTILTFLKHNDLDVPALCQDERLLPTAVCRLCLVKVKGSDHWLPSCRTKLVHGMEIETHLPEIELYRKEILQLLAENYPASALTENPEKEFHQWLHHYGVVNHPQSDHSTIDASHPFIQVDMSRCIDCNRCVRICNELQGQFVWHIINIGEKTKIIPDSKGSLADSSCVSCGACADTCPTGAIEDKQFKQYGKPDQKVQSVCPYCGVGCQIDVAIKDNKVVGIQPSLHSQVNKGHLCVKGRYAWEYIYADDRITGPMIRNDDGWQTVSWETAIQYCAEKLKAIAGEYGRDSIGIIGSARATNEDNYVVQKFARAVIGTNNVENCARVCHQPTAKAMSMTLGTSASTNSFDDIEKARTILVAGANVTGSHPIVGARIKQAVLHGANLIVVDPRETELSHYATYHLQLKAGTNIALLNAMAHVIVKEGLYDKEFVEQRTEGWEKFKKHIGSFTPEWAAKICGVDSNFIRDAARLYAKETPSICFHGLGLTEHTQGTEGVIALVHLALLTGNMGKPGTGINPLRGQNNVQGAAAMGCDSSVYTGMASVVNDRERFERLWEIPLPAGKGLNLLEMMDAACAGSLKAMWITGYDVFFTMPNEKHTQLAFDNLDFVIVQDMFLNETAKKFGHVFLPVASSFEKDGTFMNAERRIQKVRKIISSPQNVPADWEVVCKMAKAMGKGELFNFTNAEEIWNEIRKTWPAVYGITYERLENVGLQWPCPDTDHPGTKILHTATFPFEGGKAKLLAIDFKPTGEQSDAEYPFILITGRELYHFNSGTMTYRTPIQIIKDTDVLEIHPDDAFGLGLKAGDHARVISRYGETSLPISIGRSVKKGEVYSSFSNNQVLINRVTSSFRDNYVQTPEYKVTAVRIEKMQ